MKNILLAAVAFAALSTSAFGLDGKIGRVELYPSGTVRVILELADGTNDNRKLVAIGDVAKAQLAAVLTAKSMNSDVELKIGTANGESGWTAVNLK